MESVIINGIFTLAGVFIGGVISYLTARDKKEVAALNRQIKELQENNNIHKTQIISLCNQVSAYWNIEKAYSEEIASITQKNAKTILQKRRDSIAAKGFVRPSLTSNDVNKILEKL